MELNIAIQAYRETLLIIANHSGFAVVIRGGEIIPDFIRSPHERQVELRVVAGVVEYVIPVCICLAVSVIFHILKRKEKHIRIGGSVAIKIRFLREGHVLLRIKDFEFEGVVNM